MLPGIPPNGTPESTEFWLSFWAALYSGLLYSLFTGIVVGIVVLSIQWSAERRRTRREYERDFASFLGALRTVLNQAESVSISSPSASIPGTARAVAQLINDHPVDVWSEWLKRKKPFFQAISEFQRAYMDLSTVANALGQRLNTVIRHHNASKDIISVNDPTDVAFFVGRVLGFADSEILPVLDMSESAIPKRFEASFQAISDDKLATDLTNEFLQ